ncbi:NfuA Fe-S protein maturation [Klebsiella pneumoniae]|uniref:NfuA Fe-S protein maturation n=1 Tax=Klebsiella pneumoniae TaxID=573 RepID=A0A447RW77_KLEPN|nr:NfuA Fe-S protein maturation [Klebsiella pneumoniae]
MIRISDAAQAHFAKLLANQEEGTQIRVFVINPGTPNAECGVSYCPPDAVEDTDTALKFEQLTAYVDELSAPYLEDAEIDFVTDQLGSQLTLKAPNAKMRKVSDDAPLMERVEYLLQSQIKPAAGGPRRPRIADGDHRRRSGYPAVRRRMQRLLDGRRDPERRY